MEAHAPCASLLSCRCLRTSVAHLQVALVPDAKISLFHPSCSLLRHFVVLFVIKIVFHSAVWYLYLVKTKHLHPLYFIVQTKRLLQQILAQFKHC